jgi:hypothetical protein
MEDIPNDLHDKFLDLLRDYLKHID